MRRSIRYPAVGAFLAMGAPAGLLLLHALTRGAGPIASWVAHELRSGAADYAYLALATPVVFAILGLILGRREDGLEASALTDPLTGLWNRRQTLARLRDELSRAARYEQPLSLLFIDVDRLKQINDRGGHGAGDAALRKVAEATRSSVRTTDLIARYGGDEFAVIAPNTTADDGVVLAERIRNAVKSDGDAGPTVSIGVADLKDAPALEATELCLAADRALYRAKAQGRDRVARA